MRILLLSYEYPPLGGGGGVAAALFAREWARAGHAVTVVTTGMPGLPSTECDAGVFIHRVPVPARSARATATIVSMLAYVPQAVGFARARWSRADFDLVLSWFAIPTGVAGVIIARAWKLPHVVSVLGGDIYDPSKSTSPHRTLGLKQVVRYVLSSANHVVAESTDLATRACETYRLPQALRVIPLGIDAEPFTPTYADRGAITIVTVARLVRRKLLRNLIEALAVLPRGQVELVVLGDGPEFDSLTRLVGAHGLAPHVRLLGYVDDETKMAWLRRADVFALVSEHEGFGLVYLEAAAHGLPIVAGTVGGQTDFLHDGLTGWLVPPGDVQQLAAALANLATQPALRQRMGSQAQAVAKRYQIAGLAARYAELFRELAGDGPTTFTSA